MESREVAVNWKLENVVLVFKEDPGNYTAVSLTSIPTKIMENTTLGSIEKCLEGNTVIGHSQQGPVNRESCLSNLISFYNSVTDLVTIFSIFYPLQTFLTQLL